MKNSKNRVDYVIKKTVVNKNNIERLFAQYPTKRQIRRSQQKKLLDALKTGKSFPVMYVNRGSPISNKLVVLDGNHRLEALREFFEEFPNKSVELQLGVYDIKDSESEKAKFLELNRIIRPSSDDIIQQYKDDLPFLKDLLDQVDVVSVYNSKPLKVRNLMHAYVHAKKPKWQSEILKGEDLVKYMTAYNQTEIDEIKDFLKDYQNIFGVLTKDCMFVKTTILQVMFRIWYQNKDRVEKKKMEKKFRKLMTETIFIEASIKGGNTVVMEYGEKFIDFLNRGRNYNFVLENPPQIVAPF